MKLTSYFLTFTLILFSFSGHAQKPKKTHNHEKFAKKAVMSMMYIEKMCANDAALQYMSEQSGRSMDELKSEQAANLASIKEDVAFITDNGIFGVMDNIELTNVRETPYKMADIVVNYTMKGSPFQFVLTNCVQTNISWYMGDGIDPRGSGIQDVIDLRAAKKEKAENGILGTLNDIGEKEDARREAAEKEQARIDSINATRKGYYGQSFPMVGIDKSSKWYRHHYTNMPMEGYYITNDGEKVNAIIAYQKIEFLVGDLAESSSLFLCKAADGKTLDVLNPDQEPNFDRWMKKSDIQAFYVGDQLYARVPNKGWRIITSEGAIHTYVSIVKFNEGDQTNYQAFELTQKMDGEAYGSILGPAKAKQIIAMMSDCPELVERYTSGELSLLQTIIKYNFWYDLTYDPARYLPLGE